MKLIERIYYGIIGKPVKSLLMMLVMFIIANLLSGSLILYNTTQTTLNSIKKQVAPVVIFEYPESLKKFNYKNPLTAKENNEMIEKQKLVFEEIQKLDQVAYSDIAMYENYENSEITKSYFDSGETKARYNMEKETFASNNIYPLVFKSNYCELIEGRYFTEEEIKNDYNVILVRDDFITLKENGKRNVASVGDKVILSKNLYSGFDPFYENEEQAITNWEFYNKDLIDKVTEEFEIIGIYRQVESSITFDDSDRWYHLNIIIPTSAYENLLDDYGKLRTIHQNHEYVDSPYFYKYNAYNYFELKDSEDIPVFLEKVKAIFKKYDLEGYKANVSNDSYLKVAGPLEALNSVSKTIIVSTIIISFIVLGLVSAMIIRDRKNEVGILLSLGESKKRIMIQFVCEMLLIGCLAIASSMITSKQFSKAMGDVIMNAYGETQEIDTTDQVILNDVTKQSVLDEYETELATSDTLLLSFFTSSVIVLTCSLSVLVVLKMKPKEILM